MRQKWNLQLEDIQKKQLEPSRQSNKMSPRIQHYPGKSCSDLGKDQINNMSQRQYICAKSTLKCTLEKQNFLKEISPD